MYKRQHISSVQITADRTDVIRLSCLRNRSILRRSGRWRNRRSNCGLRLCNGCRRTFLRHNRILLGPVGRSILGSTPLNHFMVIFVRHRMRIRFAGQRIEQPGENDLMGTAIDRMQHFTNQSPGKTSFHQRDAPQGVITVSGVFIAVTAALEPENRDNTTIGPLGNNRQSETCLLYTSQPPSAGSTSWSSFRTTM